MFFGCLKLYFSGLQRLEPGNNENNIPHFKFLIFYVLHLNNVNFWALSAVHFSNLQRSEPRNNENNNIAHL
jgi:hypothetical protein